MASSNPSNFANLPKDELREIAAKGGHASHGGDHSGDSAGSDHAGRNADGTFVKGSSVASELGAQGGHASHGGGVSININFFKCQSLTDHQSNGADSHAGRNADGTFTKGSSVASELGAQGGHASHSGGSHGSDTQAGRNPDGTFTKGSEVAKELGAQGGHAAHEHQTNADDGVSTSVEEMKDRS